MILVTVGGDIHGFPRLINRAIALVKENKIQEKVIIQAGNTNISIEECEHFDFVDWFSFEELLAKSDTIISHAGAGTIMNALKYEKPVIVVPRMKKFGEHINNHQIQLAKALAEQNRIIPVYDIENLEASIRRSADFKPKSSRESRSDIIKTIENFCKDSVV